MLNVAFEESTLNKKIFISGISSFTERDVIDDQQEIQICSRVINGGDEAI